MLAQRLWVEVVEVVEFVCIQRLRVTRRRQLTAEERRAYKLKGEKAQEEGTSETQNLQILVVGIYSAPFPENDTYMCMIKRSTYIRTNYYSSCRPNLPV